jgi:prepilin signal peptidase PulO-like enzyme (type II secretory pathway)
MFELMLIYFEHFLTIDSISLKFVILFTAFSFGLCIGSFIQACAYRIPRGISLVFPPSKCPSCKNHLKWYQNFPLLGWLCQCGVCIQCDEPIPLRYLLVEILFGFLSVILFSYFILFDLHYALYFQTFFLCCWLFLLAVIDQEHGILPDSLTLIPLASYVLYDVFLMEKVTRDWNYIELLIPFLFILFCTGILKRAFLKTMALFLGSLIEEKTQKLLRWNSLNILSKSNISIGIIFGILMFYYSFNFSSRAKYSMVGFLIAWSLLSLVAWLSSKIAKQDALGGGDIKCLACLGYFFGLNSILMILVVMCLTSGVNGGILYLRNKKTMLRLGPFIAISTLAIYVLEYFVSVATFFK